MKKLVLLILFLVPIILNGQDSIPTMFDCGTMLDDSNEVEALQDACSTDFCTFLNNHYGDIVPTGNGILKIRTNIVIMQRADGTGNFDLDNEDDMYFLEGIFATINEKLINNMEEDCAINNCYYYARCYNVDNSINHYDNVHIEFVPNYIEIKDNYGWNHRNDNEPYNYYTRTKDYLKYIFNLIQQQSNYIPGINIIMTEDQVGWDYYENGTNPWSLDNSVWHPYYGGLAYSTESVMDDNEDYMIIHAPDTYLGKLCREQYYGFSEIDSRNIMANGFMHEYGHSLFGLYHTSCPKNVMNPSGSESLSSKSSITGCQIRDMMKVLMTMNVRNMVECDEVLPFYHYINKDETWNNDLRIYGNILIKSGNKLNIVCRLNMAPDAKIIVEQGAKLILDGGEITSKCGKWEGIIVEGNSNKDQPDYWNMPNSDEAGIVITKNGASINNAHIGISTNYSGQWTDQKWGGVVHCEDTDFSGCWKGIEFMKYDRENKSYINNCTFSGWKEGITIWDCDGIEIEHCTFDNQDKGVAFLDAKVVISNDNTFSNCTRGILAMESTPSSSRLVVELDNEFIDNDTAIVVSGQNYSRISNDNYFESNDVGIKVVGYNRVDIKDNFFMGNFANITSDLSGNNYNRFSCNTMTGQDIGIWYIYENQKSEFISNDFIGSYDSDVYGSNANINEQVGSEYGAAMNLFSDIDHDLYWSSLLGNSSFEYYLPENPVPRTDPKFIGNFIEYQGKNENDANCAYIEPPVITTTVLTEVKNDFCYWYNKYKENPHNETYRKKYLKYEKKLHSYYYYWLNEGQKKSWKEIEIILKTICGQKWKVDLFGHYLSTGYFTQADSMLNVINAMRTGGEDGIPEDMSDEQINSFVEIQQINIKLQQSMGTYQITESEREILKSNMLKNIPESAYAIGTYYLATGEVISRPLPEYVGSFEYRAEKYIKQDWIVYPNPVTNKLNVLYSGDKKPSGSVAIYDIVGNEIIKENYQLKRGSKKQLDVSGLKHGVYLLQVLDNDNKLIKMKKLVVGNNK